MKEIAFGAKAITGLLLIILLVAVIAGVVPVLLVTGAIIVYLVADVLYAGAMLPAAGTTPQRGGEENEQ